MKEHQSPSHTKWDCKYHVVFIPKRRKKQIFGTLRRHLGRIFHGLAGHKVSTVGLDEAMVRAYIRNQDQQDERYEIS